MSIRRYPGEQPAPRGMTQERAARALIAVAHFAVDLVILFVVMMMLLFGLYSIWDTNQIYAVADAKVFETYKPGADEDNSPSFAELQELNPDVIGWITIYGTGVDYPVVQGEDNDEYMNKTAAGNFSLGGAIFLDWQNAADFSDFNSILYGHHMDQNQMFGDIDLFEDEAYFDSHPYGNLYYAGRNHGLEFFAMVDANAYDFTLCNPQVDSPAEYLSYVRSIARHWKEDVAVYSSDHIVMLYTCASTSTNGRYVLFGVLRDQVYEDTFVEETTLIARTISTASNAGAVSILYLVIAVAIAALLLGIVLVRRYLNRQRSMMGAERRARRRAWEDEDWPILHEDDDDWDDGEVY